MGRNRRKMIQCSYPELDSSVFINNFLNSKHLSPKEAPTGLQHREGRQWSGQEGGPAAYQAFKQFSQFKNHQVQAQLLRLFPLLKDIRRDRTKARAAHPSGQGRHTTHGQIKNTLKPAPPLSSAHLRQSLHILIDRKSVV